MIESYTPQLVVFEGCPASLGQVGRRLLQRGAPTVFLCILAPNEPSNAVKRTWEFSLQSLDPNLTLVILHEPRNRTFEGIAEFATEFLRSRQTGDLDLLFVSEEASWRGTRRLARELGQLQTRLNGTNNRCVVRRV